MSTKLEIVLSDGTPVVQLNKVLEHSTPIELSVSPMSPQAVRSADIYMQSLNYLFRGVSNIASGRIKKVAVEKSWFGRIEKEMDKTIWNAVADKNFVVVYDITADSISEHYYVAEAVAYRKGKNRKIEPIWNEALIKPSPKTIKEGIITAIEIATEFTDRYRLVWGYKGKQGLFVLNHKGKKIDVDDIDDDEIYLVFRLLLLLSSKELHTGVFCIDADRISDKTLEAIIQASKTFFGDGFIFIKHLNPNSRIKRETVHLPVLQYT